MLSFQLCPRKKKMTKSVVCDIQVTISPLALCLVKKKNAPMHNIVIILNSYCLIVLFAFGIDPILVLQAVI